MCSNENNPCSRYTGSGADRLVLRKRHRLARLVVFMSDGTNWDSISRRVGKSRPAGWIVKYCKLGKRYLCRSSW